MIDHTLPLLQTKLQRPRVTHDLVVRRRLWAMLDRGLEKPLTLVCAGPGFGKTTLVSSWLEEMATRTQIATPTSAAWLALDENDSDLVTFLRYVVAALRTIFSNACSETMNLLQSPQQPRPALLIATLINELGRLPTRAILVLDDFSALRSEAVNGLLAALVRNWPRPLHLVLITRHNPPLSLPMLRASDAIMELRSRHLRFSHAETIAYLDQVLATPLDDDAVAVLEQRTEGWIAGMKLATLSLDTGTSVAALVAALADSDVNITEYLADEVLAQQPPAVQAFLLQTSILDHFCVPLCVALLGNVESGWSAAECIHWLVTANLFIVALDNQSEWYRYHHLFRDVLRERARAELTAAQVNVLERRAAMWFAAQHLVNEALHWALRAGDLELTVRLIEEGLPDVLNREDRPTLERWLRLLPADFVERQPVLLMLKAWVLQFAWQLRAQVKVLDQIEALLDDGNGETWRAETVGILAAQIAVLRGQAAFWSNQPERALTFLAAALSYLPATWTYLRGGAMMYRGLSMQVSGEFIAAEKMLLEQFDQHSSNTDGFTLRLQSALCHNYLAEGALESGRQTAAEMLRLAEVRCMETMQSWAHYFLGMVYYQWNDLASAERHFAAILERRHAAIMLVVREGMIQLALTQQVRGRSAEAWRIMELLGQLELEQSGRESDATCAMRARLLLLRGDLPGAARWADAYTAPPPNQALLHLTNPQLIRASILMARQGEADLLTARHILDSLYAIAEHTHNTRFLIELQAMRGVLLETQGDSAGGLAAARAAVEQARPGGFVRVFADVGPSMQALLERLARQGVNVQQLLAAFPTATSHNGAGAATGAIAQSPPVRGPAPEPAGLAESLTGRERQVLALLCEPVSNKEIAHRLNISVATVKRHTINIYGKLGVNSRWDAAAKAAALQHSPQR